MAGQIVEVDRVEILTLQDNYVDLVSRDNTAVIQRAMPLKGLEVKNSILAEHGFSALVTVTRNGQARSLLFDFGFSENGAAFNAEALNADLGRVEALALSHGHLDHTGGLARLAALIGQPGLELVLHPAAFRRPRYMKITEEFKVYFPSFTREMVQAAGLKLVETDKPYPLLDGGVLFLGEVARVTPFEKGTPYIFYQEAGREKWDPIEDDTGIVMNLKGKGLVVLSGCAHSGIVNTVKHARSVTGINQVHCVMGGFHLTGPELAAVVGPTTEALKDINPDYIVPTHCTGRQPALVMEKEMPEKFLLNMSGTKMTFSS
ncbi:MAG: MBL fold metallo-hydrolase [Thermodesulfobacteriota bacterium]